jgi:hypothetical protein
MQQKTPPARETIQTSSVAQSHGVPVVVSTEGAGLGVMLEVRQELIEGGLAGVDPDAVRAVVEVNAGLGEVLLKAGRALRGLSRISHYFPQNLLGRFHPQALQISPEFVLTNSIGKI